MAKTEVARTSYVASGDGTEVPGRVTRQGSMIVTDQITQWALEGRLYHISPDVQETPPLAGETVPGTDNVNPSILVDVPEGTTIIPLELRLHNEGIGTVGDWLRNRIATDNIVRFASGGVTLTIHPNRKDTPHGSQCTAFHGGTQIVTVANNIDDNQAYLVTNVLHRDFPSTEWSASTGVPPVLVGPASFLVYVDVNNADEGVAFSVTWAEFPTNEII